MSDSADFKRGAAGALLQSRQQLKAGYFDEALYSALRAAECYAKAKNHTDSLALRSMLDKDIEKCLEQIKFIYRQNSGHKQKIIQKPQKEMQRESQKEEDSQFRLLPQKSDVRFAHVVGLERVKEEIKKAVIYPLRYPDIYAHYGKQAGGGILLYGPPGCGKCVSADTPVVLSNGELKNISDLYAQARKIRKEINLNEYETIIKNPDKEVLSLNTKSLKFERKKIEYIYRQRYKGKIYEIITHSGRRISVTSEHPFISIHNGVRKIRATDLSLGSYIAIPRELKTFPTHLDPIELKDFRRIQTPNGEMLQFISPKHPRTKMINPVFDINEEVASYFGYLLSEGASIKGTLYFSNSDQSLIKNVVNTTIRTFGVTPRIKPDTSKGVYRVEIGSVSLMRFLEEVYDFKLRGSRNARIPASILRSDLKVVSKFISAVFECEASIRKDVPEIEFTTASEGFANELAYLLLRFGIVSRIKSKRIRKNDHTYWRLYISGHKNLKHFEAAIGFMSKRKINQLRKWTTRNITGSTNTDSIPNIQNLLKETRERFGENKSRFYKSKNGYRYEISKAMSRAYLANILKGKFSSQELKQLRILSESKVLWDKVVKINVKEIDDYVYDLTITDNHTFIAGFGGVIVSNTFLAKAAAGECGANFFSLKVGEVLSKWLGESERNIKAAFDTARTSTQSVPNTPAVLFFDEIDALGAKRTLSHSTVTRLVNCLLVELDGLEVGNDKLLTLAATNEPWVLDPALRRPGRFSKMIFVPPPDSAAREELFRFYTKSRPLEEIDYAALAERTAGYSSADIAQICEEAADIPLLEALHSSGENMRPITMIDFYHILEGRKSSLPAWFKLARDRLRRNKEEDIFADVLKESEKFGEG